MHTSRSRGERGVAVLEFAILAPVLLGLVLGAVEFGQRYKTGSSYTDAAGVAARSYALTNSATSATSAARNAGVPSSVTPTYSFKFDSGTTTSSCSPALDGTYPSVTVTIVSPQMNAVTAMPRLIPGISKTYTVTGKAVARCAV